MATISMKAPIRVLSVDDHPLIREGIIAVISSQPDMEVVAQASNGHDAIECFRKHKPDITLMDLRLPDMSGIDAVMALRTEFPDARIIILTNFDSCAEVKSAFAAGALSYMLKAMAPMEMAETIRSVHAGKKHIPSEVATLLAEHLGDDALTGRELEVLSYLTSGNRNRDIAKKLFIAEETVKGHMKHIMNKLDAIDRTQALAVALRRGLIQL